MARTAYYKGFTIQFTPQDQTGWRQRQLRIAIFCKMPQGSRTPEFWSELMYPSEQDTDVHVITFRQAQILFDFAKGVEHGRLVKIFCLAIGRPSLLQSGATIALGATVLC